MALPQTRSCSAELIEGMTDGTYKKVVQNRGGVVDDQWTARQQLSIKLYGIVEAPQKVLANGEVVTTPNTVPTKDPEALGY